MLSTSWTLVFQSYSVYRHPTLSWYNLWALTPVYLSTAGENDTIIGITVQKYFYMFLVNSLSLSLNHLFLHNHLSVSAETDISVHNFINIYRDDFDFHIYILSTLCFQVHFLYPVLIQLIHLKWWEQCLANSKHYCHYYHVIRGHQKQIPLVVF